MRAELLAAEAEARDKKRKAEGKPPLAVENGNAAGDEEANKRRKLLQEAMEMDKDEDDDDDEQNDDEGAPQKGKEKAKADDENDDECVHTLCAHCSHAYAPSPE